MKILKDIIKKQKDTEDLESKKGSMEHALKSLSPEIESEDEDEGEMEESSKKGMAPEAKIEIELILESAKKKKGK